MSGSIDTSSWHIEKAENIVAALSFVYGHVERHQPLDERALDDILAVLSGAAWDATKLLAVAAGAPWRTDDRDLVTTGRREDYELLLARYGLATSPEARRQLEVEQIARDRAREHAALSDLLGVLVEAVYPGAPNERSLVRSAVDACLVELPAVRRLRGLLEAQAQNELTWPDFVDLAQQHIADIVRRRDELAAFPDGE